MASVKVEDKEKRVNKKDEPLQKREKRRRKARCRE